MQEELRLGWEVVVDDVVQHGYVYTASGDISHEQHHGFPVHKFTNVDLPSGLIESTVDVGALDAF